MWNSEHFDIANGVLRQCLCNNRHIRIPSTVTAIAPHALFSCIGMTTLYIPASVSTIGLPLLHSAAVEEIRVDKHNPVFYDRDGVLYGKIDGETVLIAYPRARKGAHAVPDGVTVIAPNAFAFCESLTALQLPASVHTLGSAAFSFCTSLRQITLPNSIRGVPAQAFSHCYKLADIHLPDGICTVGERAFESCSALEELTLPDTLQTIGDYAFRNCFTLRHIDIPDSVHTLGEGVFFMLDQLQSLYARGVTRIGSALLSSASTATVCCPRLPLPKDATPACKRRLLRGFFEHSDQYAPEVAHSYVTYALRQRKALLPFVFETDNVTALNFYLDNNRITLDTFESVFFAPAKAAGATACVARLLAWKADNITPEDEERLLERELMRDPFSATDMKKLWSCKKLDDGTLLLTDYKGESGDVTVPVRIGKTPVSALDHELFSPNRSRRTNTRRAFFRNSLRRVNIPDGVKMLGHGLFCDCTALESVTLPQGLTVIGEQLFENCHALTAVDLPDSVTAIEAQAFASCLALQTLALPARLRKIASGAFAHCHSLKSITIPESVPELRRVTFLACKSLSRVTVTHTLYAIHPDAFSFCEKLTLCAPADSAAARFAASHNIPLEVTDP